MLVIHIFLHRSCTGTLLWIVVLILQRCASEWSELSDLDAYCLLQL